MRKRYWHFTEDLKLSHGDDRPIVVGETLSVDGEIRVCANGLHGASDIVEAFFCACMVVNTREIKYVSWVEIWGDLIDSGDKVCGRYRKVLSITSCERFLKKHLHLFCDVPHKTDEYKRLLRSFGERIIKQAMEKK